jgi:quercetin dioxygenase-like cupin family protein
MPLPGHDAPAAPYTFLPDLAALVGEIQPDSIVSRQVHADDVVKITLFGFATGQELSEHTASKPAILQVLAGEGTFGLGDERFDVGPGSFAHMAPHLPHTVTARTPLVLLLTMFKGAPAA